MSEPTTPAETPKTPPTKEEIDHWNNYLKYFNDQTKTRAITDEQLDKGDGMYSKQMFNSFNLLSKNNYDYDEMTKKMQDYYNSMYNSPDQFTSSLVRNNYPKPELSAVDGRVGSYTRNYYIPKYQYGDNKGVKVQGVIDPYNNAINVTNSQNASPEEAQQIFRKSASDYVAKNSAANTVAKK